MEVILSDITRINWIEPFNRKCWDQGLLAKDNEIESIMIEETKERIKVEKSVWDHKKAEFEKPLI